MATVHAVTMSATFCDEEKKYDGRIVIETHLVGARKNDIASRKWRLTKHRNSNSNSQVWIIRTSSGFKRQGTLNATVCSLSLAVVRWVFLMIRNSFNLYQLFSQSFILILERKGKKISGVLLGLSYKNNLRLTCLNLRGLYPNRSDLQLVFAIQGDSKSQT